MDDPEVAEQLAAAPEPSGPPISPPLSEFTPDIALLTVIAERLHEVTAQLVHNAGGKPPQLQPLPRPRTGVDTARARLERKAHEDLVDEVKAAQERWLQARQEAAEAGA